MADYGGNFDYGDSFYKDEGVTDVFYAIEPIVLLTFENRAFYFSHRSNQFDNREYRLGEFLKRNTWEDRFIMGG